MLLGSGDEDDVVRCFILNNIAVGTWKRGARLPTERELAARFSRSRSAVRKTLTFLEAQGKIFRKVGSGTYVTAPRSDMEATPEEEWRRVSLHQLLEARLTLEPQLASVAIANATESDISSIALWLDRGEASVSVEAFEEADQGFHLSIARATHNELLMRAFETISGVRGSAHWRSLKLKRHLDAPNRRADVCAEHRLILEAIEDRNQEAVRSRMRDHLLGVRLNLFAF